MPRYGQNGFTVIELLIVLAIGGVLAVIAVPSMRDMLNSTRQSSALSLLVSDLNLARGEAIKRNSRTLVCLRNALGTDCVTGSTNWAAGWLVCTDADANDACDPTTVANPNPVVVRPPVDVSLTLVGPATVIRFNANSSQGTGGAAAALTVGGAWAGATPRTLSIAATGNITKS